MPKKIKTVDDLKKAYPELAEKLIDEGAERAAQAGQKYIQERLKKAVDLQADTLLKLNQELVLAVIKAFIWDPAEKEDPHILRWAAENGLYPEDPDETAN